VYMKISMLIVILALVAACGGKPAEEPDWVATQVVVVRAAAQTLTSEATVLWTVAPTLTPSSLPSDTSTPEPTATSTATQTKLPTALATLAPIHTATPPATPVASSTATLAPTVPAAQQAPTATRAKATSAPAVVAATDGPATKAPVVTGRIAFSAGGQLHVVDAATGQDTVAPIPDLKQPDLRADGDQIIAKGFQGPKTSLWTIDANTGQYIREQGHYSDDFRPTWSPDGSHFAYDSLHQGLGTQVLYTQELDSKEDQYLLYRDSEIRGTSPVWMHDDWIAFTACDYWPKATGGSKCGIYRLQVSGGDLEFVKPDSLTVRATDSFASQLVYMSQESGDWEVYVVSGTGGDSRNLSKSAGSQDGLGTFSPDGRQVAFASDRDGGWAIWVAGVDGSGLAKLFDLPAPLTGDWTAEHISWGP
jgi:hypothetical protein